MRKLLASHAAALTVIVYAATGFAERRLAPIETVGIGRNRELRVNGKPFFPVMMLQQTASRIRAASALGANALVENGGEESKKEFLSKLRENGLYGVLGADMDVVGDPNSLGLIHLHPSRWKSTIAPTPSGGRDRGRPGTNSSTTCGPNIDVARPKNVARQNHATVIQ